MTTFPVPWSLSVYALIQSNSTHNIHSSNPRHFLRWSRDIEDRVWSQNLSCDLYAGFQFLSLFEAQKARYASLSRMLTNVWIFAQPDQPQDLPTGLHLVVLSPAHELSHEWFVLVNHPRYARLFAARELPPGLDGKRHWTGILTSDRAIVAHVADVLQGHLAHETMYARS